MTRIFQSIVMTMVLASPIYEASRAFAQDSFETQSTSDEADPHHKSDGNRKKKKKKRKKSSDSDQEAPRDESVAMGKTIHAAQEGQDSPYEWDAGLSSDFAIVNTELAGNKQGSGVYNLNLKTLRIFAHAIEFGGELTFNEQSTKATDALTTDRTVIFEFLGIYNFGNLDTDSMVFFVGLGFGVGTKTNTAKAGDVKTDTSASIQRLGIKIGLHFFVDSNVALTTEVGYDSDAVKAKGAAEAAKTNTIHLATLGFSLFI